MEWETDWKITKNGRLERCVTAMNRDSDRNQNSQDIGKWRDLPSLMTRWATLILSCDEARAFVLPDSMLRERSAKGNEDAELPKQCDENESYQRRSERPRQRSITAEIHPNRNPGVRALTPTRATAMAVPKTAE